MTDQQTYTNDLGEPLLTIYLDDTFAADLLIELPAVTVVHRVGVPPLRLLAMIDTLAPHAMRAYLRERSDYLDSPHDAVPEADSPEDVDERPEPVIALTPDALAAAELLGRMAAEFNTAFTRGFTR